jgi:serine/threonine protein phosphatase PrpC
VETTGARRQLVSHSGTLGHVMRRVQEFEFDFPAGALLILQSDGLTTRWTSDEYPGLLAKHAGLIAGVLYRDHNRGTDDVTVVVLKNSAHA